MPENGQERTEDATPHRRQEARRKGQVARSPELPGAVALVTGVLVLRGVGPGIWSALANMVQQRLADVAQGDLTPSAALGMVGGAATAAGLAVAPVVLALAGAGVAAGLAQTRFTVAPAALRPKFDRLNPLTGAKRIFSLNAGFELAKMSLRLVILGVAAWSSLQSLAGQLVALGGTGLLAAPGWIGNAVFTLVLRVSLAGLGLAAADYAYQRWHFNRELRMTRQEIREETRQNEGDPQIRARIRRLQRQRARQRMLRAVPEATVVVANPSHFAVALRYAAGERRAPLVVAKGQDYLAQQIKALAAKHGVPVIENPPLARTLYAAVPLGREIPASLYRAVAEVLALVYRIKRRW